MDAKEFEPLLADAEHRLDRLKALYEQYFQGLERLEPTVPRKDFERRLAALKKDPSRNVALRFRLQNLVQRFTTFTAYWARVMRQIEDGTYRRHVLRARERQQALERARHETRFEHGAEGEFDLDDARPGERLLDGVEDMFDAAFDSIRGKSGPPPSLPGLTEPPGLPGLDSAPPRSFAARPADAPALPGTRVSSDAKPIFEERADASRWADDLFEAPAPAPFATPPASERGSARDAVPRRGEAQVNAAAAPAGRVPRGPADPLAGAAAVSDPLVAETGHRSGATPRASAAPARHPNVAPNASNGAPRQAFPARGDAMAAPAPGPSRAQPNPSSRDVALGAAKAGPAPRAPVAAASARSPTPAGAKVGRVNGGPAGAPPSGSPSSLGDDRMRRLYLEYVEARRRNNESIDNVRYESVAKSIETMLPKLREKHAGKRIDFEVVVKDGRVGLKPVAKG